MKSYSLRRTIYEHAYRPLMKRILCMYKMAQWFVFAGVIPKADWNHKPQSNGCGSLGIEVVKLFDKV